MPWLRRHSEFVDDYEKFSMEELVYKKLSVKFANPTAGIEGFLRSSKTAVPTFWTSPGTVSTAPASGSASKAPPEAISLRSQKEGNA